MKTIFWASTMFFLSTLPLHAATIAKKTVYLSNAPYVVHEVRPGIWASENCIRDCQALKAVDRVNQSRDRKEPNLGGRNPRAWRCSNLAGGVVAILADDKGNQNSYCVFKDQSMVDCGAFK